MTKTSPGSADMSAAHASPRCGAKTRSGKPCNAPVVNGKKRCRMHGGAERSGAPYGNKNAEKHGLRSKASREELKDMNRQWRSIRAAMRQNQKIRVRREKLLSKLFGPET